MLVFHIGILTETERSKVAKRKTATHLNKLIFFFFSHNRTAVPHKMHPCGAEMEHEEKPVMQHPIPDRHEGSCPKLAVPDCSAAALLSWDNAVAGERQGWSDAWVPQTQQSEPLAWKTLCPTWRANVAYPDLEFAMSAGSQWVGSAFRGPLHLRGRSGSSGRDQQGGEKIGSGS